MYDKRFTVHNMIKGYNVGEDIDFDFLRELVIEQRNTSDLSMDILDNGKPMTYKECCDILNSLNYAKESIISIIKEEFEESYRAYDVLGKTKNPINPKRTKKNLIVREAETMILAKILRRIDEEV